MKETDIRDSVRKAVLERDSIDGCPCCIYCGKPFPHGGAHLHHVKKRSQLGLGEESNLVTLCWKCHAELHDGDMDIQRFCEEYLEERYGILDESK